MADALENKINQWLLRAKREELSADDLFSQVEHYYFEGIGGIDWAGSVLAGTAAVLSLSPGHQRATDLHSALQISRITFGKQADDLFQLAQSKFAPEDLRRSIDLLKRHTGREVRYRQAKELLSRIKEKIQSGVTADPNINEAKLLLHEVEDLEIILMPPEDDVTRTKSRALTTTALHSEGLPSGSDIHSGRSTS